MITQRSNWLSSLIILKVIIILSIPTISLSEKATPFEIIMSSMENNKIKLIGSPHGDRSFKVFKKKQTWYLRPNGETEYKKIKYLGNNIILINHFPIHWGINGKWEYSNDKNKCKFKHKVNKKQEMHWKC